MDVGSLLAITKGLWCLARKPLWYIYNLKDNVQSLENEKQKLTDMRDDVKANVDDQEARARRRCSMEVATWLRKVPEFADEVNGVLQQAKDFQEIKCLDRCRPRNCLLNYTLGKRVGDMLNQAKDLKNKKNAFGDLTTPLPPPLALGMPTDETVRLDISNFNEVRKWLVDKEQVKLIGICGMGGVGKTTLMKRINEEPSLADHGFDIVIWVHVSKPVDKDGVQNTIRKRLGIADELWNPWTWTDRVHHLSEYLARKKFLLLIDDLWEKLDLADYGVRRFDHEKGSKIVFTTRLKHVCDLMGADKTLEIQCLNSEEALILFWKNIVKSLPYGHQEIQKLAEGIVEECGGLPLALATVGQAMVGKHDPGEWRHELTRLRRKPHTVPGMVEKVYRKLELSYESLRICTQRCLLSCCLFPKDYPIVKDELIELWIGEDLLERIDGKSDDVNSMRDGGESVLGDLKNACLLESRLNSKGEQCVKMHNVIRNMASWIARDRGTRENKLLVIEKEEEMSPEMISRLEEAEKASLCEGQWENLKHTPRRCSELKTLLIRRTKVNDVPREFFDSMTASLTVLDLSGNKDIKKFPGGICILINLRFLNLSATRINELPWEIKDLTCLRWLLLDDLPDQVLIPLGAITSLPLNVFSQWSSDMRVSSQVKEEEMVEELGRMQHLTDVSISMFKSSSALKVFQSSDLQNRIRRVRITDKQKVLTSVETSYSPAKVIYLYNCPELKNMKVTQEIGRAPTNSCLPNLVEVRVYGCGKLLDLSWLVHAPNLRKLDVHECSSMEKIIGGGFAGEDSAALQPFSNLESLNVSYLEKLTSICDQPVSFPQGVSFHIFRCLNLRELPLKKDGALRGFSIDGDKYWWNNFEWNGEARVTFQKHKATAVDKSTFEEAKRTIKKEGLFSAKIGF